MSRLLHDLTEAEIREAAGHEAEHVQYALKDYVAELDRRATGRQARLALALSVASLAIAVAAFAVGVLRG